MPEHHQMNYEDKNTPNYQENIITIAQKIDILVNYCQQKDFIYLFVYLSS